MLLKNFEYVLLICWCFRVKYFGIIFDIMLIMFILEGEEILMKKFRLI